MIHVSLMSFLVIDGYQLHYTKGITMVSYFIGEYTPCCAIEFIEVSLDINWFQCRSRIFGANR